MIECAMCRRNYDPEKSGSACAGCTLLTQGCGHSRCPFCGYENQRPLKDAATGFLARWRERVNGSRH